MYVYMYMYISMHRLVDLLFVCFLYLLCTGVGFGPFGA